MQFNSQWKTILVLCPCYLSFLFIFLKVVFVCQSRSKVWIQAGRYWMTMRLRLKRSSIAIDYLFNVLSRMTPSEKWRWKIYAPSAELWEVVQCRPLLHKVCFVSHFKYVTYPPKRQAGREGWGVVVLPTESPAPCSICASARVLTEEDTGTFVLFEHLSVCVLCSTLLVRLLSFLNYSKNEKVMLSKITSLWL